MAVNKNFVVKNGLEVKDNLLVADGTTSKVGIGTSVSSYELHVLGGVGATDAHFTGITTINNELRVGLGGTIITGLVGGFVGLGTTNPIFALDVQTASSTGTTAIYAKGDVHVTGNLDVTGDIAYDEVTGRNLAISGVTSLSGTVYGSNNAVTGNAFVVGSGVSIAGITTLAGGGGITTTGGDFYVGGDLYVLDDIVYDEVTGRNINITGISTFARVLSGPIDITAGGLEVSAGISTFKGTVSLPDDVSITLGNDDDLEIHHAAGANSYIKNNTLQLELRSDTTNLNSKNNSVTFVKANASGLMATTGITTVGVASITDVVVSGATTFNGPTTFNYGAITFANVNATNQNVSGIGTIGIASITDAVVSGAATFNNDITVLGDLNVTGDLSYDEVTGRNLNITGIATIATLVGYSSEFSGAVGFQSGGTLIGAAITTINMVGGGSTTEVSADGNTGTIYLPAQGASIGLAIALGG